MKFDLVTRDADVTTGWPSLKPTGPARSSQAEVTDNIDMLLVTAAVDNDKEVDRYWFEPAFHLG